jgi:hypothetical protein
MGLTRSLAVSSASTTSVSTRWPPLTEVAPDQSPRADAEGARPRGAAEDHRMLVTLLSDDSNFMTGRWSRQRRHGVH